MTQIKIDGITYNLIGEKPVAGRPGRKELKLQRPKGRRYYYAVVYENGSMSAAI